MKMNKLLTVVAAGAALMAGSAASAQDNWPNRPIRLVLPYAAGGYTDLTGRITARFLEKELGQPVVVETKAGAGGILGTDFVAKAAPDGYTLCMCSVGAVSIAPVSQKVGYDPLKDLAPISIVSSIPLAVIVNPAVPVKNMTELIAYAKANPDKLNYGSSGVGGLMNFAVQLFEFRTGARLTHVPYKGGLPATVGVVAGEVELAFTNLTDALPQMEGGKVNAIAVTSAERSPFAPALPTVRETGVPDYVVETWNGVIGPRGLPQPIVDRLSEALRKMAADPESQQALAKIGATPVFITPQKYRETIVGEVNQWGALMKEVAAATKR